MSYVYDCSGIPRQGNAGQGCVGDESGSNGNVLALPEPTGTNPWLEGSEIKSEVGYVQRYLIPEGTPIQIGIVGPQSYQGINYPGGGNQVQILNILDRANLIPIGSSYEIF